MNDFTLEKLINTRLSFSKKLMELDDNHPDYEMYDKKLDDNAEEIENYVKLNFDEIAVDDIIEACTHLGEAPNLIYDDNGNFCIAYDGFQDVSYDEKEYPKNFAFFIDDNKRWKTTIREALRYYIFENK